MYVANLQQELFKVAASLPMETSSAQTGTTPSSSSDLAEPAVKKCSSFLLSHYKTTANSQTSSFAEPAKQLVDYLALINFSSFVQRPIVQLLSEFPLINRWFDFVLCAPASSAPVESAFSQS
jgi:hypothetical protein